MVVISDVSKHLKTMVTWNGGKEHERPMINSPKAKQFFVESAGRLEIPGDRRSIEFIRKNSGNQMGIALKKLRKS